MCSTYPSRVCVLHDTFTTMSCTVLSHRALVSPFVRQPDWFALRVICWSERLLVCHVTQVDNSVVLSAYAGAGVGASVFVGPESGSITKAIRNTSHTASQPPCNCCATIILARTTLRCRTTIVDKFATLGPNAVVSDPLTHYSLPTWPYHHHRGALLHR